MEVLATLRRGRSPRRRSGRREYLADDEESALATPYSSAPASPRRAFAKASVEEAPLGEVRAAVPFVWEVIPGKRKDEVAESSLSSDETRDSGCQECGSPSSPGGSESSDSCCTELGFGGRFDGVAEPVSGRAARELVSSGQLRPLPLPPRLQAVRYLRTADGSCSNSGRGGGSFQSCFAPPIAGSSKKSVSLWRFTKAGEEVAALGVQERKLQRASCLSPPWMFNRESSPSGNNLSSDSASSASSSSSFPERNIDTSEAEGNPQGGAPKDLLFTDPAMALMRVENLKSVTSPRLEQSRREFLKKQQEQWNGLADSKEADEPATPTAFTPSLTRSNAMSRPSIDVGIKYSLKENVGRANFANRFGMLRGCIGMVALPNSP